MWTKVLIAKIKQNLCRIAHSDALNKDTQCVNYSLKYTVIDYL